MAECVSSILSLAPAPRELAHISSPAVTVLNAKSLQLGPPAARLALSSLVDAIGQASAVAQGLHSPVTSASRLVAAPDQTCYVAVEGRSALGFIKVGRRQLFIAHGGSLRELPNPLVVLDFFVAASVRRRGLGRTLFDAMCSMEGVASPAELAYDRPSAMFLSFLRRHFDLHAFCPQATNIVVFEDYFALKGTLSPPPTPGLRGHAASRGGVTSDPGSAARSGGSRGVVSPGGVVGFSAHTGGGSDVRCIPGADDRRPTPSADGRAGSPSRLLNDRSLGYYLPSAPGPGAAAAAPSDRREWVTAPGFGTAPPLGGGGSVASIALGYPAMPAAPRRRAAPDVTR